MSDNVNSQFFSVTITLLMMAIDLIRIVHNYILSNILLIVYFNMYT